LEYKEALLSTRVYAKP